VIAVVTVAGFAAFRAQAGSELAAARLAAEMALVRKNSLLDFDFIADSPGSAGTLPGAVLWAPAGSQPIF
jgi:hypothetical protein